MVVILRYNEPDRGGIEKEHSKIHLGVNASACTTDRDIAVLFQNVEHLEK